MSQNRPNALFILPSGAGPSVLLNFLIRFLFCACIALLIVLYPSCVGSKLSETSQSPAPLTFIISLNKSQFLPSLSSTTLVVRRSRYGKECDRGPGVTFMGSCDHAPLSRLLTWNTRPITPITALFWGLKRSRSPEFDICKAVSARSISFGRASGDWVVIEALFTC